MKIFESQMAPGKAARKRTLEAQKELAVSLHREGRYTQARRLSRATIDSLTADETELLIVLANNLAIIERAEKNYAEALRVQLEIAPLVRTCSDPLSIANFHNGLALTYKLIAKEESVPSFYDRALIEYEAARFHYELANDHRFTGGIDNNIASLLSELGRFEEAHEYLDRARGIFAGRVDDLDGAARLAEIDDTRARLLLKQGRYREARKYAALSVEALSDTSEPVLYERSLDTLREIVEAEQHDARRVLTLNALMEQGGSVPRAARQLGLSRQGLEKRLHEIYPELNAYAERRSRTSRVESESCA